MDNATIDYLMDIFKSLSTELPDQLLYREDANSIELKTPDSVESCLLPDLQDTGWNLIGALIPEAA